METSSFCFLITSARACAVWAATATISAGSVLRKRVDGGPATVTVASSTPVCPSGTLVTAAHPSLPSRLRRRGGRGAAAARRRARRARRARRRPLWRRRRGTRRRSSVLNPPDEHLYFLGRRGKSPPLQGRAHGF